jgi:hypothetical protein
MAKDTAPLLTKQRKFGFKPETTTGTKIAIVAADCATPCFDPDIEYDFDTVERPTDGIVPRGKRLGQRRANIKFGTEVYGGATLPHWTVLLRSCGFSDAGTAGLFLPIQGATDTLTMAGYRSGRTKYAIGCMGTGVLTLRRGEPARFDWTFLGLADRPDGTAAPSSITYEATAPLVVGAIGFSVGTGSRITVPEIKIDLGNQLIIRGDIEGVDSAGDATGGRAAYITAVAPMVRMSPEALPLASRDWFSAHRNYTNIALAVALGADPNYLGISAAALQIDQVPGEEDEEGMLRDSLVLAATGDNYLQFDFNAP